MCEDTRPWKYTRYSFSGGFHWDSPIEALRFRLDSGLAEPAVLVYQGHGSTVFAAYSIEFDAVALLWFMTAVIRPIVPRERLLVGERYITTNLVFSLEDDDGPSATDVTPGPAATGRSNNFFPAIADLLSRDRHRLRELRDDRPEHEWARTIECAREAMARPTPLVRTGAPSFSHNPGTCAPWPGWPRSPERRELMFEGTDASFFVDPAVRDGFQPASLDQTLR
ncbi:MAG: hypothetical protein AAF138_09630 [Planctomycetota bacterium]